MGEGFEKSPNKDTQITESWKQLIERRPVVDVTTSKGIALHVECRAEPDRSIEYRAFLSGMPSGGMVARVFCRFPKKGFVQMGDAQVYEIQGKDYKREGIGTALYNLVESDVKNAGGKGLEPSWGNMNEESIAFWKDRRPDLAEEMERRGVPEE